MSREAAAIVPRGLSPTEERWCQIAKDLSEAAQRALDAGDKEAFVELLCGAAQAVQVAKAFRRMREASERC